MSAKAYSKDDRIGRLLAAIVIDDEVRTSQQNARDPHISFENMIDMLECKRSQKKYNWMSDIFIPEYASSILTSSANDASQYFANRDFVDAYLQDSGEEADKKKDAAKRLINRTLNRVDLFYYQKFMRARILNDMAGNVYARLWWDREDTDVVLRHEDRAVPMEQDIYGNEVTAENEHLREFKIQKVPIYGKMPVVDQFSFDILDGRNVFTPSGYYYSVQQMPWITVRFEKTLSQLKADQKRMGYINLDKLEKMTPPDETKTSQASSNDAGQDTFPKRTPEKPFDIYERHGSFYCKVTKKDPFGDPLEVEPGLDENGNYLEDAELLDVTMAFAESGTDRVCIRFQLIPYKDTNGKRYKPIVRGLCFIHPTRDNGLGDSVFSAELQVALNDTYNMGMDREQLSILPTLLTRRDTTGENATIYIAPGHPIELEDPKADLDTLKVESKLDQTLAGVGFLQNTMQRVKATGPTQYGETPGKASTSATAVAGAEAHSTTRNNFRSLTFEFTFLQEFYRMILLMTWQFAHYSTAEKLLGDKIENFDAGANYLFKPVSQAIETEYSRDTKIKHLDNMLAKIVQVPNPRTAGLVNAIIMMQAKLMGDEYEKVFKESQLDPNVPVTDQSSPPAAGNATAGGVPTNQSGLPISAPEAGARTAVQEQ